MSSLRFSECLLLAVPGSLNSGFLQLQVTAIVSSSRSIWQIENPGLNVWIRARSSRPEPLAPWGWSRPDIAISIGHNRAFFVIHLGDINGASLGVR